MRLHISLNSIVTFLAVAQAGSFRGAAEPLHTSQSAVSARVKQLEERLGVRLFDRTTRSVRLTDAGQRMYATAMSACAELSNIEQVLRQEAALQRGEVKLAVVPSLAQAEIPSLLAEFRQSHPGVQLRLVDVDSRRSLDMLAQRDVDLAVISDAADRQGIVFERLFWDECCLLVPVDHPLTRRKQLSLRHLQNEALIVSPQGTTLRQVLDASFDSVGAPLIAAQQISNMATLVRMVQAGFGVAIAPAKALHSVSFQGCTILSLKERPGWTVGIARQAGRSESPASHALREFLISRYAELEQLVSAGTKSKMRAKTRRADSTRHD
jgi:LysR family carnitine catabolism transcriptional activator